MEPCFKVESKIERSNAHANSQTKPILNNKLDSEKLIPNSESIVESNHKCNYIEILESMHTDCIEEIIDPLQNTPFSYRIYHNTISL